MAGSQEGSTEGGAQLVQTGFSLTLVRGCAQSEDTVLDKMRFDDPKKMCCGAVPSPPTTTEPGGSWSKNAPPPLLIQP